MHHSPSAGWVSGAGRPAGAPQQAPGHPHTSHETTNMARSQAGEGPAQTALGCWQHGPVHSHSNAQVREDCKVLQPSTTSILKDTTHRGSSSNLPDAIRFFSGRSYSTGNRAKHASPPGLSTTNSISVFLLQILPYFQSFLQLPTHLCPLALRSQLPSWCPLPPITSPEGDLSLWNHPVPAVKARICFPTHTCISF